MGQDDEEADSSPAEEADGSPAAPAEVATPTEEAAPAEPAVNPATLTWEETWDKGFALYREGRYDEAIPFLERALELEPKDPTVRAYLAECYRRTGDDERAAGFSATADDSGADCDGDCDGECDGDGDCDCDGECDCDCDDECDEDCDCDENCDCDGDCDEDCDCDCDCDCDEDCDDEDEDEENCDGGSCSMGSSSTRAHRRLGAGVTLGSNARSVGLYMEILPVRFLAVEAGLGLGNLHTNFWWLQAAILPIDSPISPAVGIGLLGNGGLNFRANPVPWNDAEYHLNRVTPYVHVGAVLVTRRGFTLGFDFNGIITFDPSLPLVPWAGVKVGLML